MCGIVGTVMAQATRRADLHVLRRMADRIVHRGPDDEGFVVRGRAGLGMRRLKIIDLETGHQPMTGEDGATAPVEGSLAEVGGGCSKSRRRRNSVRTCASSAAPKEREK